MNFKVNSMLCLSALSCVFALAGCQVDDQRIISNQDQAIANPAPTSKDFRAVQARHRVLLAVLDSGVDYNHPLLADNMHFELDSQGMPVRLGKDLVANDSWPAPYVMRTSTYDPNLSPEERTLSEMDASVIRTLIETEPALSAVLNPARQHRQEFETEVYHGTHVAGLMLQGRPDFGLLAYRVVPDNRHENLAHDSRIEMIDRVVEAIHLAAADGAKIINLSLGLNFSKTFRYDGDGAQEDFRNLREQKARLETVVRRYPQILFVAAAGNDSAWSDNTNRFQIPCGLSASNVLCVSALQEDGSALPSANIPIGGVDLVFALGHHLLSTIPTSMCIDESMRRLDLLIPGSPQQTLNSIAAQLKSACLSGNSMAYKSGTSAAAPLVSHLAAQIAALHPRVSGRELIRRIKRIALPAFIGNVPVRKLDVQAPTWAGVEQE